MMSAIRIIYVKKFAIKGWGGGGQRSLPFKVDLLTPSSREAANKVPPLMARPLRGGKRPGRAIKETRTLFETFLKFCCHLKIKIILL